MDFLLLCRHRRGLNTKGKDERGEKKQDSAKIGRMRRPFIALIKFI